MFLTPKARKILGFIEGHELLHKLGPDFSQIVAYYDGAVARHYVSSEMRTLLARLCDHGYILKTGRRYKTVKSQRSLVLAFNRASGTLEPYNVDAPIRDLVTGEV